jgi:hypothetical protein
VAAEQVEHYSAQNPTTISLPITYLNPDETFNPLKNIQMMLVEAAGVEPASEKARREKNYVRFRFGGCRPPH